MSRKARIIPGSACVSHAGKRVLAIANFPVRCQDPPNLPQRCSLFVAALELEYHPFDVLVVLVRLEELQALLRIAPLQDLDWLLPSAPRIHRTLIRHVEIDSITPGERPAVILHAIHLPSR